MEIKRTMLFSALTIAFIGCGAKPEVVEAPVEVVSAATLPELPELPAPSSEGSFAPKLKGECREGYADGEYGCDETKGDICPVAMGDIRVDPAFHVVSVHRCDCGGNHPAYVHVADDCQHYFCGVDRACITQGGSAEQCMVTTNCLLVHKLEN